MPVFSVTTTARPCDGKSFLGHPCSENSLGTNANGWIYQIFSQPKRKYWAHGSFNITKNWKTLEMRKITTIQTIENLRGGTRKVGDQEGEAKPLCVRAACV